LKNSSVNSAGLRGQVAGETELCTVGQSGTGLTYRGYEITDLAENAEFEEIAFLLLKGHLPNLQELNNYKSKLKKLSNFYADPGRGSRIVYCFYTDKLVKIQKPEKNITVSFKSKKQIISLIKNKKFNNASHIAAFFNYLNLI